MIVLLFEPGGLALPDDLLINVNSIDPAATAQWYCTWYNSPSTTLPYRNNGIQGIGIVAMNVPAPTLKPSQIQEITEITIYNPGPSPISVTIEFRRGFSGVTTRLMTCALGGEQTLSYNATPGNNGSWQVYDNSAFLFSSR